MRLRILDMQKKIDEELASVLESSNVEWTYYMGSWTGGKKLLGPFIKVTLPEANWEKLHDKRGNAGVVGEIFSTWYGGVKKVTIARRPCMSGSATKGYQLRREITVVLA